MRTKKTILLCLISKCRLFEDDNRRRFGEDNNLD